MSSKKKGRKSTIKFSENASSSSSLESDPNSLKAVYERFRSVAKADKKKSGKCSSSDDNETSLLYKAFTKLLVKPSKSIAVKTTLEQPTYECFIKNFKKRGFNKIITLVGAGISTSAGIPDFRSLDNGLYTKLNKYDLPYPQAIFEIDYFKKKPEVFYNFAKQLVPTNFKPTISHCFVKLLELKGILLRHYTQNIDGLERKIDLNENKLIEAHGTFQTAHCVKCEACYSLDWVKQEMESTTVPICVPCGGIVKPDIIFFGESLPQKFFENMAKDFYETDLLIIMGSSLVVEPFASLVRRVDKYCPRIIINNQQVGTKVGIKYEKKFNRRDIFVKGSCDEGCLKIAKDLGWEEELNNLIKEYQG